MGESLIQKDRACYICGSQPAELHHIIYGRGRRSLSDKYGLTVYLCPVHHRDTRYGVHFNKDLDAALKRKAQEAFEAAHPDLNFIEIFGRNYL